MALDHTADAGGTVEKADERASAEQPPPPDRPGTAGAPSRGDSRAATAQGGDRSAGAAPTEEPRTSGPASSPSAGAAGEGQGPTEQIDEVPSESADARDAEVVGADSAEVPDAESDDDQPEALGTDGQETEIDSDGDAEPQQAADDLADEADRDGGKKRVVVDKDTDGVGPHSAGPTPEAGGWFGGADQTSPDHTAASDGNSDRPEYPEVTDRSEYTFTEREYAFAEVSPQQAQDMHSQRVPLGMDGARWGECLNELREALANEGIGDADVRLQGPGARFCSEDPKKWFPQNEDELRAKVAEHHRNAPEQDRTQRAENAVSAYRAAGFSQDGRKPVAPFFDSLHRLNLSDRPDGYDFEIVSDDLARRLQEQATDAPDTESRPQGDTRFEHRHHEHAAPALHTWARRWEDTLDREVTLTTFDRQVPDAASHDDDWTVIAPEEPR
ncbi:hypothetical protein F8568_040395 [Actinomadura sp. LD22]|uniref:Uncharacterized protein n=1 Tax=Actinomadura physcomitrii TaxID=2650748 RepID=A0A6I4MVZ4_9ACTN|nr:hypothetical protein [Actinomadura physcomitrii]MWA06506.1 hypothetical protein [Actinomadura physcomitrii]